MNKNVSLAIEKAVGSISQKNQNELKNNGPKKPDLFSLSGETELFQNEKGITIKIDRSRDANLTDFGKETLKDRYLGQNESFQYGIYSFLWAMCSFKWRPFKYDNYNSTSTKNYFVQ